MKGEFTNYCKRFYDLLCQWTELEWRFNKLLNEAMPYTGQTAISELDAILHTSRRIQKARAKADECITQLQQTEQTLSQIFAWFEIQPNTVLTCEVTGFFELELWMDDDNNVHCIKTKDLAPLEKDANIITIHFADKTYVSADDDEDQFDEEV